MSFDAHSLERLAALGRTLPSKLPSPSGTPGAAADDPKSDGDQPPRRDRRHRLETEQDPARLFRALMQASSDGTVPPHLLDRLRELERQAPPPPAPSARGGGPAPQRRRPGRDPASGTDDSLYTAFSQLLLEEEEDGD